MISLSVNLNKIALIRNSRAGNEPSVTAAANICLAAGCQGITVHPRPDQRHIRPSDVRDLKDFLQHYPLEPRPELNIEGRPQEEFLLLVEVIRPDQVTLVPDGPGQLTSDHGWDFVGSAAELKAVMPRVKKTGARIALFADANPLTVARARDLGADRVELYTGPYAEAFKKGAAHAEMSRLFAAAESAVHAGLEVNAGHDLTVANLPPLRDLPGLKEVSIGHHLVGHALEVGLSRSVLDYRKALGQKI